MLKCFLNWIRYRCKIVPAIKLRSRLSSVFTYPCDEDLTDSLWQLVKGQVLQVKITHRITIEETQKLNSRSLEGRNKIWDDAIHVRLNTEKPENIIKEKINSENENHNPS